MAKLRQKTYRKWRQEQEQLIRDKYRSIVQSSFPNLIWDEVRKVKVKMELSPVKDVKDNGKDFSKYKGNKRKGRKDLSLLLYEAGDTEHERRLSTVNAAFSSVSMRRP